MSDISSSIQGGGKPRVLFSRKKIAFVEESGYVDGEMVTYWKANFSEGGCSFSCFIKPTKEGMYRTQKGGKEIGFFMTMTAFKKKGGGSYRR